MVIQKARRLVHLVLLVAGIFILAVGLDAQKHYEDQILFQTTGLAWDIKPKTGAFITIVAVGLLLSSVTFYKIPPREDYDPY